VVAGANNPEYWNPTTRETADHSLPYLMGAAVVDGAITEAAFTPARYRDPAIVALIKKIRMDEDKEFTAAYPRMFHCRFELTLKSGEGAHGEPDQS
jgi:2-methylcitrate dehydratase